MHQLPIPSKRTGGEFAYLVDFVKIRTEAYRNDGRRKPIISRWFIGNT